MKIVSRAGKSREEDHVTSVPTFSVRILPPPPKDYFYKAGKPMRIGIFNEMFSGKAFLKNGRLISIKPMAALKLLLVCQLIHSAK